MILKNLSWAPSESSRIHSLPPEAEISLIILDLKNGSLIIKPMIFCIWIAFGSPPLVKTYLREWSFITNLINLPLAYASSGVGVLGVSSVFSASLSAGASGLAGAP